ncbi:5'-methylthioadenosine/adenosylhomocysteine nucleosidase [Spirochaetia bacterium 38H-sp]|uniref:adenosylhomocysteine nucleosidase n=1 Tax=Rarispira pelagica TaxID=3141764 RepID=A0ABU9UBT2_9SPIR
MILVLGAMREELACFSEHFEFVDGDEWNGVPVNRMRYKNLELVVAKSGVGKVLAAMVCQHLIEEYRPEAVVFTGIAGSVNPSLCVGDLVVSLDCVQHDLDATAMGIERGRVPYTVYRFIEADKGLVDKMRGFSPDWGRVHFGRVLTGDQFIAGEQRARMPYLTEELKGDVVEMEGASVALVCRVNAVPFVLLRVVSDNADGNAPDDFSAFLNRSSSHLAEALEFLFDRWG